MIGRATAGLAGACALAALWLPWFQPDGDSVVMFGAVDRLPELLTPTAWQAFGWEDTVLAALAVATIAVAVAGRRWWVVPLAGALSAGGVMIAHRSREPYEEFVRVAGPGPSYTVPASEAGLVPVVAFAVAAALAAGRYRLRRR